MKKIESLLTWCLQFDLIPTINNLTKMTKNKISAVDHIIPNSVINSKFETGIVTACTSDDFLVIYRYLFWEINLSGIILPEA